MAAPAHSRERLLAAGTALFAERGFNATTTRDIGLRAGVDAALIVRHFGSKVGFYLACLEAEHDGSPADLLQSERMLGMLALVDTAVPGPVFQAAVALQSDETVRAASTAALHGRVVDPLYEHFSRNGAEQPRLRAELVAAAFAGIALGRSSGAFGVLAQVPATEIVALVQEAFQIRAGSTRRTTKTS